MNYNLDLESGIPIYRQLKERIKFAIATGEIKPGDQLPTVRQLAVDLQVNMNTVSRVYSELEREGYLATRQGKGTFVRDTAPTERIIDPARDERLELLIEKFLVDAYNLGFTPEDLKTRICCKISGLQERIREESRND